MWGLHMIQNAIFQHTNIIPCGSQSWLSSDIFAIIRYMSVDVLLLPDGKLEIQWVNTTNFLYVRMARKILCDQHKSILYCLFHQGQWRISMHGYELYPYSTIFMSSGWLHPLTNRVQHKRRERSGVDINLWWPKLIVSVTNNTNDIHINWTFLYQFNLTSAVSPPSLKIAYSQTGR